MTGLNLMPTCMEGGGRGGGGEFGDLGIWTTRTFKSSKNWLHYALARPASSRLVMLQIWNFIGHTR